MTLLPDAIANWKTANPFPQKNGDGSLTTQAQYDAMAAERGQWVLDVEARKLAGQAEIEALGFTVAQTRNVYIMLKAGNASAANAQKALAGVIRFLWRDLVNDQ